MTARQTYLDPDDPTVDHASDPTVDHASDPTVDHASDPTVDHASERRDAARPPVRPTGFGQRGPEYDEPVFVISVAAELADMHPQTLRAYEREGLIEPARTAGNTRRYSQRDIDRLRFIRHLTQEEGLNLAGVRVVLDLGEKLEGSRRRIRELEEMVRTLAARLTDDVEAAHRSHRFEVVPTGPRDMEVHPRMRRRSPRRPERTAG